MLDKVAESFGQKCYEVPVGFKYISAKMQETDAIIGGESSGGLTVKGHIHGKDGIYAASLLVEMIAVTGKSLSEIVKDIEDQYGETHMEERSYRFTAEEKARIQKVLLEEQKLPELPFEVSRVSYQDGCKSVEMELFFWYTDGTNKPSALADSRARQRVFASLKNTRGTAACIQEKQTEMQYIKHINFSTGNAKKGVPCSFYRSYLQLQYWLEQFLQAAAGLAIWCRNRQNRRTMP